MFESKACRAVLLALLSLALWGCARQGQRLACRISSDPKEVGVQTRSVVLELAAAAPQGVPLPQSLGARACFAKWPTARAAGGFILIACSRRSSGDFYDTLYVDSDADGALDDESPISPAGSSPHRSRFGPVEIRFPAENGPAPYHVVVTCVDYPDYKQLIVSSACWYEGTVTVGGKKTKCVLVDYDANATFNDVAPDPKTSDRISLASSGAPAPLGKYVSLGGRRYRVVPSADGASVRFTRAWRVPEGKILVPQGITALTIAGDTGTISFRVSGRPLKVPSGKWRIQAWRAQAKGPDGVAWTLSAADPTSAPVFEVPEDGEVSVDVGPPVIASLSVRRLPPSYVFQEVLKGRFGETVRLSCGNDPPPVPAVRIRNADGSYDTVSQFRYG